MNIEAKQRKVQRLKDKRAKLKTRARGVKATTLRRLERKLDKAKDKLRRAQRLQDIQIRKRGQGR